MLFGLLPVMKYVMIRLLLDNKVKRYNQSFMKKKVSYLCFVFILLSFAGCSGDDEHGKATHDAAKALIGKWKLVEKGGIKIPESSIYLSFTTTGMVVKDWKDPEPHTAEYSFHLENDWNYDEDNQVYWGHIVLGYSNSSLNPYNCRINGDEMMLLPSNKVIFYNDPTEIYERVK